MSDSIANETPAKRVAALDLGTNSFHVVIVDIYPDGSFRTVDKLKEMVILAEKGMVNHLSAEAMDRGISALQKSKYCATVMMWSASWPMPPALSVKRKTAGNLYSE